MDLAGSGDSKKRGGEGWKGKIEKHTLSCGQDIGREKHTHTCTRSVRECR